MSFTVVYDACVLYPAPLRDFLLHLAATDLFRARWSEWIHIEWMRNLLARRPDLSRERLQRTRQLMDQSVPDCLVTGYEGLIDSLNLPDSNDRHVLAAPKIPVLTSIPCLNKGWLAPLSSSRR